MKQLAIILFAALAACVIPPSGAFDQTYATQQASATVAINGQVLTVDQLSKLEALIGERVPAGRYVLDEGGMFGLEGHSERVNLAAHINARQSGGNTDGGGGTVMHDSRGGSTMVGYGNCVAMTTPSGTFMGSGC
ncbi:MAG: hypothetical protein H0T89_19405 [Deltaproteobacteria bacterium]|nr:hypothetical protein [Deltaproteobacteria bacterium]